MMGSRRFEQPFLGSNDRGIDTGRRYPSGNNRYNQNNHQFGNADRGRSGRREEMGSYRMERREESFRRGRTTPPMKQNDSSYYGARDNFERNRMSPQRNRFQNDDFGGYDDMPNQQGMQDWNRQGRGRNDDDMPMNRNSGMFSQRGNRDSYNRPDNEPYVEDDDMYSRRGNVNMQSTSDRYPDNRNSASDGFRSNYSRDGQQMYSDQKYTDGRRPDFRGPQMSTGNRCGSPQEMFQQVSDTYSDFSKPETGFDPPMNRMNRDFNQEQGYGREVGRQMQNKDYEERLSFEIKYQKNVNPSERSVVFTPQNKPAILSGDNRNYEDQDFSRDIDSVPRRMHDETGFRSKQSFDGRNNNRDLYPQNMRAITYKIDNDADIRSSRNVGSFPQQIQDDSGFNSRQSFAGYSDNRDSEIRSSRNTGSFPQRMSDDSGFNSRQSFGGYNDNRDLEVRSSGNVGSFPQRMSSDSGFNSRQSFVGCNDNRDLEVRNSRNTDSFAQQMPPDRSVSKPAFAAGNGNRNFQPNVNNLPNTMGGVDVKQMTAAGMVLLNLRNEMQAFLSQAASRGNPASSFGMGPGNVHNTFPNEPTQRNMPMNQNKPKGTLPKPKITLEEVQNHKGPYGFLVVFYLCEEHPTSSLQKTAAFFKKEYEQIYEFDKASDSWKGKILIDGQVVYETTNKNHYVCKLESNQGAMDKLRQHYFTILMTSNYGTNKVVDCNGEFVDKAGKLVGSKLVNPPGTVRVPGYQWHKVVQDRDKLKDIILHYKENKLEINDLVFSCELDKKERKSLEKFSGLNGLAITKGGGRRNRFLVVSKKNDIMAILYYLIEVDQYRHPSHKYILLRPGEDLASSRIPLARILFSPSEKKIKKNKVVAQK